MKHKLISVALITILLFMALGNIIACGPTTPTNYTLTIASTDGGNVTTPGEGTYNYTAGTVVNLVATPADVVYQFVNWTGDVATVANANVNSASTTITISGNYIVTANFVRRLITRIIFNGDVSEKIDVVFVGSGFPDITSFNQTVLQLIDYDGNSNGLMSIEPFLSNKTRFNFWAVETLQTFTNTTFPNESEKLAKSIAPFAEKKVVLFVTPTIWDHADIWGNFNNQSEWIWTDSGGFGAYVTVGTQFLTDTGWPLQADYNVSGNPYATSQNLSYTKDQVKWSFVHEFGHSFGGLFDEYNAYGCISGSTCIPRAANPPQVANCALPPCDKWSSITNYCQTPCGYTDWCSSSADSIMRFIPRDPPPPSFNIVSRNELIKDMSSYLAGTSSLITGNSASDPSQSYVLTITYSNGTFIPGNLTVVPAPAPNKSSQPSTGYNVQISSASGTILYSTYVGVTAVVGAPSPDWFDEDGNQIYIPNETIHILDPFETKLILPFFSDAKKISMYDPEGMLVFDVHI